MSCVAKTDKAGTVSDKGSNFIEKTHSQRELQDVNNDSLLALIIQRTAKSQDKDTALAYFLYTNFDSFSPEYKIQYQRFDLEYEKQIKLIKGLYSYDPNLRSKLEKLNNVRNKYLEYAREKVWNEYRKFNAVSGRDFDFLAKRKDSTVLKIVTLLIANDSASKYEKRFGVEEIIKYYGDSTFYKKLYGAESD